MEKFLLDSDFRQERTEWLLKRFEYAPLHKRVPVSAVRDVMIEHTSNNTEIGIVVRLAFPQIQRKKCDKFYYYYGMDCLPAVNDPVLSHVATCKYGVPNSCSDPCSEFSLMKLEYLNMPVSSETHNVLSETFSKQPLSASEQQRDCFRHEGYAGEIVFLYFISKKKTSEIKVIEEAARELGAIVEPMLNKQITLVITDIEENVLQGKLPSRISQNSRSSHIVELAKGNMKAKQSFLDKIRSFECRIESASKIEQKIKFHHTPTDQKNKTANCPTDQKNKTTNLPVKEDGTVSN